MHKQGDANSYGAIKKKEEMMGKMVQIVRGEYKGQHGQVKNVTETEVRVLLSSKSRLITTNKEDVILEHEAGLSKANDVSLFSAKTPAYVANSPGYHGYQTPAGGMSHYEPTHQQDFD